ADFLLPARADTVHWGYISRAIPPVLYVPSGAGSGRSEAGSQGSPLEEMDHPMLETQTEWLVHGFSVPNYLDTLGPTAQSDIYGKSSIDDAMRDAFRKMRKFLMTTKGLTEDEAHSLMSVGVDFGITQVVDGNWGVHAIVKKDIFAGRV
ncbi:MAG: hypothetical protein SWN98_14830, partial [Pseudomonadota bacterium]|nr:hypothetical protein [Pseudomonadota bacterium]